MLDKKGGKMQLDHGNAKGSWISKLEPRKRMIEEEKRGVTPP